MPYVKREDCELYYEIHGTGIPFLMLHGNGEDGTYFYHQIQAFSKQYQVMTMDMRGHGKSSLGSTPLDFELFAQDVIALLDMLEIDQCILLGFSDGGNTALRLGSIMPKRLLALIVNGANHAPSGIKCTVQIPVIIDYWMNRIFRKWSREGRQRTKILNLMVHHPHITQEMLLHITCPVLLIYGKKDVVKKQESAWLLQCIPKAKLVNIAGDHFIAVKKPKIYNEQISEFLNSLDYNE